MPDARMEPDTKGRADSEYLLTVAGQILDYVRDRLVIFMPFFNRAVLCMPCVFEHFGDGSPEERSCGIATNGAVVTADPEEVVRLCRQGTEKLTRAYLHMLIHCVYRHPFRLEKLERNLWDFAADAAAEQTILSLGIGELALPDDRLRLESISELTLRAGDVSAERIYHYLSEHPAEAAAALKRRELIRMDSHVPWFSGNEAAVREVYTTKAAMEDFEENVRHWMKLTQTTGIENISQRQGMGEKAGTRRTRLAGLTRDDYDYSEFLARFAAPVEEVKLNPEEFDYIYYTYGLDLYGNVPLIEPLEYRDAKKITDLVIAIDTSGSCQGHTVKMFLMKTYSLLKNSDIFTERMNLRILQCDCEIQSEALITSDGEFEEYMKTIEIRGAGGTDFVPVFDRVDELLAGGAFHDFRGLLYFTDGLGHFPDRKPSFRTAFIFVGRQAEMPVLPVWAERYQLAE